MILGIGIVTLSLLVITLIVAVKHLVNAAIRDFEKLF